MITRSKRIAALVLLGAGLLVMTLWSAAGNVSAATQPVIPGKAQARTNPPIAAKKASPATAQASARTNLAPAAAAARTNLPAKAAPPPANTSSGESTNAPSVFSGISKLIHSIPPTYYPTLGFAVLGLVAFIVWLRSKAQTKVAPGRAPVKRKAAPAQIRVCNVLQANGTRFLWQFGARGGGFSLHREQEIPSEAALPAGQGSKDWRALWQPRLNIAWLPPEQVFLKVVHLPASDLDETLSMVELQLEKLSPMPVAQVVWAIHVLPHTDPSMQAVLVTIVARSVVEQFLGRLEGDGFLADRLELPFIDQLQATDFASDGAWLYPFASSLGKETALIAWWYGKTVRDLALLVLPAENRVQAVKEQLVQMTWAGELEGWLTSSPGWRLVADATAAQTWEPVLREALETQVEVVPALPPAELARRTAARAANPAAPPNLLPPEYTARYHQQFVDRLWMGALGGVVGVYLVFLAVYFIAVQVASFRTRSVEQEVVRMGPTYTNAMQLKAQYQVLKDRQELKYAALDCWRKVAELLPADMTLGNFTFSDGKRLTLQGTAPIGPVTPLYAFESAMRKATVGDQLLFEPLKGESLSYHGAPGGNAISWSFSLELKRSEVR